MAQHEQGHPSKSAWNCRAVHRIGPNSLHNARYQTKQSSTPNGSHRTGQGPGVNGEAFGRILRTIGPNRTRNAALAMLGRLSPFILQRLSAPHLHQTKPSPKRNALESLRNGDLRIISKKNWLAVHRIEKKMKKNAARTASYYYVTTKTGTVSV